MDRTKRHGKDFKVLMSGINTAKIGRIVRRYRIFDSLNNSDTLG